MDHIKLVEELCNGYREKLERYEVIKPKLVGKRRIRGISVGDLHIPFCREDLVKQIVKEHAGLDFCVVNGDLFDLSLINTFIKKKEVPLAVEYAAAMEIVRLLAKNFGEVVLVDGNHDAGRYTREMGKLNPSVLFLVKSSPLQYIAQGRLFSPTGEDNGIISLPNVRYAGDVGANWWHRMGKTIFCHRLSGYRKDPLRNAVYMADHFLRRGIEFQCLVSAHSHHAGMAPYVGGRWIIDQGALCLPMDYERSGNGAYSPVDLGYAYIEMDTLGNIDVDVSRFIYLGTYQER